MTCACIPNADETAIVTPCQLHDRWARDKYAAGEYWHPMAPASTDLRPGPQPPSELQRRRAAAGTAR